MKKYPLVWPVENTFSGTINVYTYYNKATGLSWSYCDWTLYVRSWIFDKGQFDAIYPYMYIKEIVLIGSAWVQYWPFPFK